jgi:hypothetical protein
MKNALQSSGFKPHNNKAAELVASKFHSSLRNVRIVVSTGIDKNTGKAIAGKQARFKAVYINNQSQWRTIASGGAFKGTKSFGSYLKAIEVAATSGPTCKCGAKKFKAKSGNVVCANACWANKGWSKKKKPVGTKKNNTSQKPATTTRPAHADRQSALRSGRNAWAASLSAGGKKAPKQPLSCVPLRDVDLSDAGVYTEFVPGQLVKVVEPQQNTLSEFVGTVTKVERASNPSNSKLLNVWVMWMHSGLTERHNNYKADRQRAGASLYLIPVA